MLNKLLWKKSTELLWLRVLRWRRFQRETQTQWTCLFNFAENQMKYCSSRSTEVRRPTSKWWISPHAPFAFVCSSELLAIFRKQHLLGLLSAIEWQITIKKAFPIFRGEAIIVLFCRKYFALAADGWCRLLLTASGALWKPESDVEIAWTALNIKQSWIEQMSFFFSSFSFIQMTSSQLCIH